jgi:hypothetical protein
VEWTLRDRLDQARADRRRAAGLPPTSPAKPLEPLGATFGHLPPGRAEPATPVGQDLQTIDGEVDAVVDGLVESDDQTGPDHDDDVFPTECACPNCAGPTRIDMLDLVLGVEHLTCIDCGLIFSTPARPTR